LTDQIPGGVHSLPLRFVDERCDFGSVQSLDALLTPSLPPGGLRWVLEDEAAIEPGDLAAWKSSRVGGAAPASWDEGQHLWRAATELRRVGPSWWHPKGGALIGLDGALPAATAAAIYFNMPRLEPLAGVAPWGEGLAFTPPPNAPTLGEVCVAFPWGIVNYGHFLLDGMTSVLAMQEAGALDRLPLATPVLRRWQRDLLRLAFGDLAWRELAAPIVRVAGAVYSPAMDHYLHRPGPLLTRLRTRLLDAVQARGVAAAVSRRRSRRRRLYVSRRAHPMRVMVNEAALQAALVRRGFQIVRPEGMDAADQIALFAQAEVIVGPTGAGLTNALFAAPGCRLVEIQPENYASFWVPAFSRLIGLDWGGYIAPSPCDPKAAPWLARQRRGFRFAYQLDLPDFLEFLDARL
jgi:capsular polysaccharide biosynthesis protein